MASASHNHQLLAPTLHVQFCTPPSTPDSPAFPTSSEHRASTSSATDDQPCQPSSSSSASSSSQPQPRHSPSHKRNSSASFSVSATTSPELSPPTKHLTTRRSLRSLTRPTSSAGLPALVNMTFAGFRDKGKAAKKDSPLSLSKADQGRFSRSMRFGKEAKKKKSLASFLHSFSSADNASVASSSAASLFSHSSQSHSTTVPAAKSSDTIRAPPRAPLRTLVNAVASASDEEDDYGKLIHRFIAKPYMKRKMGMKVHPYDDEAMYMQTYDPTCLESDDHTQMLLQRLTAGNPSFHDYGNRPPRTVLDIGCGRGTWLLQAAECWAPHGTVLTGIDMVDIRHPAVEQHEHIRFKQCDFMQYRLPFEEETFEMIRIANLGTSMTTEDWKVFIAKVNPLLVPGGRLEVIDDFVFFPYGRSSPDDDIVSPTTPKGAPDSSFDHDDDMCGTPDGSDSSATDVDSLFDARSLADTSATSCSARSSLRSDHSFGKAPILPVPIPLPPLELNLDAPTRPSRPIPPLPVAETAPILADIVPEGEVTPQATPATEAQPVLDDADSPFTASPIVASPSEPLSTVSSSDSTPSSPTSVSGAVEASEATWHERAQAAKDLEKTFKGMLANYKITDPPSSFMTNTLGEVFGHENVARTRSMHLRLAPPECTNVGAVEWEDDRASISSVDIVGGRKPWIKVEWERKDRKAEKARKAAASKLSTTHENDSSDPFVTSTAIPQGVSAKAAGRLGIAYTGTSPAASTPTTRPSSICSIPSISSASSSGTRRPNQSPGLILLPSTFIPIPPSELEMHACKNIHLLLSCKPALRDYVATFVDADGHRLVDDAQFEESIWDYECFRRQRFNWLADVPDLQFEVEDTVGPAPPPKRSATLDAPRSMSRAHSDSPTIPNFSPVASPAASKFSTNTTTASALYASEDLTHVRTFHVFEAVKPEADPFERMVTQSVPASQIQKYLNFGDVGLNSPGAAEARERRTSVGELGLRDGAGADVDTALGAKHMLFPTSPRPQPDVSG
ncbi:hypothetical protein HGRIS_008414 [Hohenbuehelia grisea]|uniref:Methyltransferase domain-containing protein n=1 Tax=Hohenbuehelia grisea TaxID=104357 RepID=A0ABR3J892_9AGAR